MHQELKETIDLLSPVKNDQPSLVNSLEKVLCNLKDLRNSIDELYEALESKKTLLNM
jgi:gamma-glutamyl phosphate reductase